MLVHYDTVGESGIHPISGEDEGRSNRNIVVASRYHRMTPTSSENLERFLADYERVGEYGLAPAVWSGSGQPNLLFDRIIGKRRLVVRHADNVKEGEIEYLAIDEEERARRRSADEAEDGTK